MAPPRPLALACVVGILLLAAGPRPAGSHDPPRDRESRDLDPRLARNPSLAVIRPAPDFRLLDVTGGVASLSELRGRVVLLSFTYASCPSACPLITQRMAMLQRGLREARLLPSRVNLLSITVDPERDSAASLGRYARGFGADPEGWRFLREAPERLGPVLGAYDEWTVHRPGGDIDHPARLHLIDREGRVREIYSLALFDERQAFLDILALLREPR
ncbi:MAG: SCO family protein [Candidatus Rokubacteria bacterium]|nr:SCO family protein [Candidatus Rokubacteria bacterium]